MDPRSDRHQDPGQDDSEGTSGEQGNPDDSRQHQSREHPVGQGLRPVGEAEEHHPASEDSPGYTEDRHLDQGTRGGAVGKGIDQ